MIICNQQQKFNPFLTHNREYWNAVSVVCRRRRRLYRIIFISLDFWTLIIYKFRKLITSVKPCSKCAMKTRRFGFDQKPKSSSLKLIA